MGTVQFKHRLCRGQRPPVLSSVGCWFFFIPSPPTRNKTQKKIFSLSFFKQFHSARALLPPFKWWQLLVIGKRKWKSLWLQLRAIAPYLKGYRFCYIPTHCVQCSALPFLLGKRDHSQSKGEPVIRCMADFACSLSRQSKKKILLVSFYFQLSSIKSISGKFQQLMSAFTG